MTILWILLVIETALLFVGGFLAARYMQRLLDYDELFQLIQDEIDTNIQNFDKLKNTPLLSNAPEIVHASKLMNTMRERLYEYVMRIEENALRERAETELVGVHGGDEEQKG